jgi:hypothetical protein
VCSIFWVLRPTSALCSGLWVKALPTRTSSTSRKKFALCQSRISPRRGLTLLRQGFLQWITAVSADANPPLVHSVSYSDVEGSLPQTYTDRLNNEFIKRAQSLVVLAAISSLSFFLSLVVLNSGGGSGCAWCDTIVCVGR